MGAEDVLLGEGLVEEPDHDGKVGAFIVGRQEDGVLVLVGYHGCCELRSNAWRRRGEVRSCIGELEAAIGYVIISL